MKKIILIIFIVSLVILVACQSQTTDQTSTSSSENIFTGTLQNAMDSGKTYKCTTNDVKGNKADLYVKGNQFRGESQTPDGKTIITVFDKDKCMWIWQESNKQGSKLCTSQQALQSSGLDSKDQPTVKTDLAVTCNPTSISDDNFIPPSDVKFSDIAEILKQAQSKALANNNPVPSSTA